MRKILLGTVASFTFLLPVTEATAATRLALNIQNNSNEIVQVNMARRQIGKVESRIRIYEKWIAKNQRRAGSRLYNLINQLLIDYREDLIIYNNILNPVTQPAPVVLVNTVSSASDKTVSRVSDPVLINTQIETSESVDGNIVQVIETTTETYQITTTTTVIRTTTVTKTYSDGKVETSSSEQMMSETQSVSTTTQVNSVVVNEYALVEEQPPVVDVTSSPILTVEEYAARDDVNIRYSDTYIEAAQSYNKNYSPLAIQHELGLGRYANWTETTGALAAWSRGYTGVGSTIAILDTGIDTDHPEFADSIVGMKCFTGMCAGGYETIEDGNGHGTHVAGIAAANLDGEGMTGVAPDANLLIGKVGFDNGYVEMDKVPEAVAWAIENGADAINLSASINYDTIYKKTFFSIGDGFYRSSDERTAYHTQGYNLLLADDSFLRPLAKTINDNEAVFVVAAGNQGLAVPSFPAHMAVMEDADGNLAAGGKVIVAGSWDISKNEISYFSNRAGTMCFDYNETQNTCNSEYRISDFYLMAPGEKVASAENDGTYTLKSGTSMAAPAISGGVALIHQMWPYMTGENIVKLMMQTGDKSFANYDVNVHGQGIMDLDAATSPQGAIGIPTTGRVDGAVSSNNGTIAMSGIQLASLSQTMILDDYDRDFYVDANRMNMSVDTRTVNPTLNAMNEANADAYLGFTRGMNIPVGDATLSVSEDNIAASFDFGGVTLGYVSENGTFLGNMANSDLIRVNGADTLYASLSQEYTNGNTTFFGNASLGLTSLNVDSNTILKDASTVVSNSIDVGTRFNTVNGSFGFVASLPVAITSGSVSTEFASSVSAEGEIATTKMEEGLSVASREVSVGMFYDFAMTDNSALSVYAEHRENYMGIAGSQTQEAGLMFSIRF